MTSHIVDDLRPVDPDIDPTWSTTTMRSILDGRATDRRRPTSSIRRSAAVAAAVAAITTGVVVARATVPEDEVRPSGPLVQTPAPTPTPSPSPTYPHPQKPQKTYVPAPGDPRIHQVTITILDRGIAYEPSTCTVLSPYYFLAFSGPSRHYENVPVGDPFSIPDQAEPTSDGTCAATMTVTIPYRPRYDLGVGREGKGILNPEVDPDVTSFVTRGASQDVTVKNYRE